MSFRWTHYLLATTLYSLRKPCSPVPELKSECNSPKTAISTQTLLYAYLRTAMREHASQLFGAGPDPSKRALVRDAQSSSSSSGSRQWRFLQPSHNSLLCGWCITRGLYGGLSTFNPSHLPSRYATLSVYASTSNCNSPNLSHAQHR